MTTWNVEALAGGHLEMAAFAVDRGIEDVMAAFPATPPHSGFDLKTSDYGPPYTPDIVDLMDRYHISVEWDDSGGAGQHWCARAPGGPIVYAEHPRSAVLRAVVSTKHWPSIDLP